MPAPAAAPRAPRPGVPQGPSQAGPGPTAPEPPTTGPLRPAPGQQGARPGTPGAAAPGYPQQGYRQPSEEEARDAPEEGEELGADVDLDGVYYQELKYYVRPDNPQMPGYTDGPDRPEYIRVEDPGKYRHDGLYVRVAGGVGSASDSVTADRTLPSQQDFGFDPAPIDATASGIAGNTEIAVGFTPFGGVAIGGGIYTASIPAMEAKVDDPDTGNYKYRISQLALFAIMVDAYFMPEKGFHAQLGGGLSTFVAGVAQPEYAGQRAQAHTAIGFGAMLGVGYDWWVSEQWSLGLLARGMYGSMSGTDSEGVTWTHKALAPSLLITATYH